MSENNHVSPKFNINAMRIGWYSDKYFLRTQEILMKDNFEHTVHYQYFPRKDVVLCGVNDVLDIFKKCTGYYSNREDAWKIFSIMKKINPYDCSLSDSASLYDCDMELNDLWVDKFNEISFELLPDGSHVSKMEPCIGIVGNPKYFAHLETATLGILAQQSAIATSVNNVCNRLNSDQTLLFFPARFRHYVNQASDGYAAVVGGAKYLSTDSNGEYWGYNSVGTIPHLLIAAYKGNTSLAAIKFDEIIDENVDRVVLVDWDNNCIKTSLELILAFYKLSKVYKTKHQKCLISDYMIKLKNESLFNLIRECKDIAHLLPEIIGKGKGKISGVRFDTSGSLIDYEVSKNIDNFGVCPELVFEARNVFDSCGLKDLKIIVSGGFNLDKIDLFQKLKTPVDMFGIGSSIVNNFHVDFTADAVMLDGKENAKIGRKMGDWSKLT